MKVSINQPCYLPWLGYYNRIKNSDLHVTLDHVQFEKNSFINRNKIRSSSSSGWSWLTVPVKTKGMFGDLNINKLEIADSLPWRQKHWKTICQSYSKAPYFSDFSPFLENYYLSEWKILLPMLNDFDMFAKDVLSIHTETVSSSSLHLTQSKSSLILEICVAVGASHYLSGPFGRSYLDLDMFRDRGIKVSFHDYSHPSYSQFHGGFQAYMSIVDLLFNLGSASKAII